MNASTNSVHQEELLWLFEENFQLNDSFAAVSKEKLFDFYFTDIINSLELWELEFQSMKEFSEFHQGVTQ